jgi:hypothetical protein
MMRSLIWLLIHCTMAGMALGVPANFAWSAQAQIEGLHVAEIDAGFHLLYELKPEEARAQFAAWQKSHSDDPLGSASEAASYLFEECYRQGVLTSEFFLDDKRFLGKIALKPDQALRAGFFSSTQRAQALAQHQLKIKPDDANALFAMTLSVGMQADYASLIDKYQLESLRMIREANGYAKKLQAVAPDAADAYFILGAVNSIIGSLPRHERFFLRFTGIRGEQARRPKAARDSRSARPIPPAVCEDFTRAGGPARAQDRSGPNSISGARRGVPQESAFCERTGQTPRRCFSSITSKVNTCLRPPSVQIPPH